MKIADLFINVGLTGAQTTNRELGKVKGTLGEISTAGLAAKAGILGAVYGLEQMMAASARTGNDLVTFANNTGISMRVLQQYQYAAVQAGATTAELQQSFEGLQSMLTKMSIGDGMPKFLGLLTTYVGKLDESKLMGPKQDIPYVFQKIQEFVRKAPPNLTKELLGFLPAHILSGMHDNVFRPEMLNKAPTYSETEARKLQGVGIQWANIGRQIEMAFGHLNAKHGGDLSANIGKIAAEILTLVGSLLTLSENLKLFSVIEKAFQGWEFIIQGLLSLVNTINGKDEKGKKTFNKKYESLDEALVDPDFQAEVQRRKKAREQSKSFSSLAFDYLSDVVAGPSVTQAQKAKSIVPSSVHSKGSNVSKTTTITQNNNPTVHVHAQGVSASQVVHEVKKQLHKQNQKAGRTATSTTDVN